MALLAGVSTEETDAMVVQKGSIGEDVGVPAPGGPAGGGPGGVDVVFPSTGRD